MDRKLTINLVLAELQRASGELGGVSQIARHLVAFGHQVTIYVRSHNRFAAPDAKGAAEFIKAHYLDTGAEVRVGTELADADFQIATCWLAAEIVDRSGAAGRKAYLVRDFEPLFYPAGLECTRAERTYRLSMLYLTLGPWLARHLHTNYGSRAFPFDFAYDRSVYHPDARIRRHPRRIAFYSMPSAPRHGFDLGIETLELVHQKRPDAEILLFGCDDLDQHHLPVGLRSFGVLSPNQAASLYRSSAVGFVASFTNPPLVPFEMMACGCPVVDIRSDRYQGLLESGVSAFLAEPTAADLAEAISSALGDAALREYVASAGYDLVKDWTWERTARQVEAILLHDLAESADFRSAEASRGRNRRLPDTPLATTVPEENADTELEGRLAEKSQLAEQIELQLRWQRRDLRDTAARLRRATVELHSFQESSVVRASSALGSAAKHALTAVERLKCRLGPISGVIDYPLADSFQPGRVSVGGWAYSSAAPIVRIEVLHRQSGSSLGVLSYGTDRMDVLRIRPWQTTAACGYYGSVDVSALPPGWNTLIVRAIDARGHWLDLRRRVLVCPEGLDCDAERPTDDGASDREAQYRVWLARNKQTVEKLLHASTESDSLAYRPLFSILVPVYNTPAGLLRQAVESVQSQAYRHWELCLVDDASTSEHVRPLLDELARSDPRIRVHLSERNRGISGATNLALDMARGEFVGLLDHDDELWPNALYECARAISANRDVDIIYSDEDKTDSTGRHYDPYFKPDWSPDLLLSVMYTGHFSVYRRELVKQAGGFRSEFDGSQDYDLALRCSEMTDRILHVPTVLYSWRAIDGSAALDSSAKPYAHPAGERALQEALSRRGIAASVEPGPSPGLWRVRYEVAGSPLVCLIVPTAGNVAALRIAIRSILEHTAYRNYEILIVGDSEGDRVRDFAATLRGPDSRVRYFECRGRPVNLSSLINQAVRQSEAAYVCVLDDDVQAFEPSWLESLLEHAQRPEVGVVGARLLYPNGLIQHTGVVLGVCGSASHLYRGMRSDVSVPFGLADVVRNVSAVTFACAMFRRSVFEELGGLDDARFKVALNDVDFCLRAGRRGYRVLYTPYATLYHHESANSAPMGRALSDEDVAFAETWGDSISHDPFYNPNLSRRRVDYSLAMVD